jgi:hypothetical protein
MSSSRTRWAAIGAAVAVTLGAGGVGLVNAQVDSGERSVLIPIEPCRLLDTRADSKVGDATTLQPDAAIDLQARGEQGNCDLPEDLSGLSLNVTAAEASEATNLRIYPTPDDDSVPTAASLNPFPGLPREFNTVVTGVSEDGEFSVYNRFGTVELVIDVVGYYVDHNHDDRYYTEEEVDQAIADSTSTVYESSTGTTGVTTATTILPATIEAPADGTVIGEAVVTVDPGVGAAAIECSLSTDAAIDADTAQSADPANIGTLAAMRSFDVTAGDSLTVNLVCEADVASDFTNPQLMLQFVPNPPATTTTTTTTTTTLAP